MARRKILRPERGSGLYCDSSGCLPLFGPGLRRQRGCGTGCRIAETWRCTPEVVRVQAHVHVPFTSFGPSPRNSYVASGRMAALLRQPCSGHLSPQPREFPYFRSPARMPQTGVLSRRSPFLYRQPLLSSNQSRSKNALPLSQVGEGSMQVKFEPFCKSHAHPPYLSNNRIFPHRLTLPSVPQGCRSRACRTPAGCRQRPLSGLSERWRGACSSRSKRSPSH